MEALSDTAVRTLAERYAEVVDDLELTAGDPLLVLPNGEFFPDRFNGDAPSVERLAARMQGYAGLEDVAIETDLTGAAASTSAAGCGTGGCGTGACEPPALGISLPRLERNADRWLLHVPSEELQNPIVLTARLATTLGAIALVERRPEGRQGALEAPEAELTAVALGFGVLLLEASYMYKKSCGGPSVACGTTLDCRELALLFALSAAREKHSLRAALAELGTTQRAVVKDAAALVAESPSLVSLLQTNPAQAARGNFKLREGSSLWSRLFARRARPQSEQARLDAALVALERGASVDEIADLVGPSNGR